MYNNNQASWTLDQHKAYAAEVERRVRQEQQANEARKSRREQSDSHR